MERIARYLIAQHVADPFRNEPKNVGVFVSIGSERTARFIGDDGSGRVDGKKTRFLPCPDVYKQWVSYWWNLVRRENLDLADLIQSSKENYRVVEGGEVARVGKDSVHDVANYLYSSLVSEGNLALALGGDDDIEAAPLKDDVSDVFTEAAILTDDKQNHKVPHPIRRGLQIQGKTETRHRPSFVQENKSLVVMDAVDLSTPKQTVARDRAAYLAFMFGDIIALNKSAKAVSIIRMTAEDEKQEKISYALSMLTGTSEVVNWLSDADRKRFIDDRVTAAMHA